MRRFVNYPRETQLILFLYASVALPFCFLPFLTLSGPLQRAKEHKKNLDELEEQLKRARQRASAQGAAPGAIFFAFVFVQWASSGRDNFHCYSQNTYLSANLVVKRDRSADEMIDEAKRYQALSAKSVDRSRELTNKLAGVKKP